jgi:hypothetical protein
MLLLCKHMTLTAAPAVTEVADYASSEDTRRRLTNDRQQEEQQLQQQQRPSGLPAPTTALAWLTEIKAGVVAALEAGAGDGTSMQSDPQQAGEITTTETQQAQWTLLLLSMTALGEQLEGLSSMNQLLSSSSAAAATRSTDGSSAAADLHKLIKQQTKLQGAVHKTLVDIQSRPTTASLQLDERVQ